jgi:hypothetical protein
VSTRTVRLNLDRVFLFIPRCVIEMRVQLNDFHLLIRIMFLDRWRRQRRQLTQEVLCCGLAKDAAAIICIAAEQINHERLLLVDMVKWLMDRIWSPVAKCDEPEWRGRCNHGSLF